MSGESTPGSDKHPWIVKNPRQIGYDTIGSIPLEWILKATDLPGKSLHVGLAVWFLVGLQNSRKVALTNMLASRFSVDRNAKYRALQWLEEAGLVSVKRKLGKAPLVTLIEIRPEK